MIELYEHQKLGCERLLKHKKFCLFFEVGTGKTFTALAALTSLPTNKRVLIVAPTRAIKGVWLTQTEYDLSQYDITYISYEKLARDKTFTKNQFDIIILDEVHKVKGKSSKSSKRIMSLSQRAEYVWGLTGTPIANSYADIYFIFKHMDIREFDMSYDEFITWYYITRDLRVTSGYSIRLPVVPKKEKLSGLLERIAAHSMTVRMNDCHELPDIVYNEIRIKGMDTDQYKEIYNGIIKTEDYEVTMTKLSSITKARQAANGYFYDVMTQEPQVFTANKKLDVYQQLVEGYLEETDKLIVVYFFKQDLKDLQTLDLPYTFSPVDFAISQDQKILLLQYGQCEALNLQFCNHIVFYTYDYSYLKFEQMVGRIKRIGQENKMVVDILINDKTIENKVWHAIKYKQSTDEFLKGVLSE